MAPDRNELALVLPGGGARAAYQAGFLCSLARHHPDLVIPILTGVSAGAINAIYLASRPGRLCEKVETLKRLWAELEPEDVFRVDAPSLVRNVLRWGVRLVSGGNPRLPGVRGLVDTRPLGKLLARHLEVKNGTIPGIGRNLEAGTLRSVAITASSYTTGQSVTWVEGRPLAGWERPTRVGFSGPLGVPHVMASAALPLLFPAVKVLSHWYGDGGIRLTEPLAPAVHLGAERILVISPRYGRSREEADRPSIAGYPPPAQVAGVILNAIFLDHIDADALGLQRINRLVEALPPERRDGLRPIRLLVLRPSTDLGLLANDYEARLPRAFRFMTRGLGTRENRSNDLLSLLMFQRDYLNRLIELGEEDAETYVEEIAALVEA